MIAKLHIILILLHRDDLKMFFALRQPKSTDMDFNMTHFYSMKRQYLMFETLDALGLGRLSMNKCERVHNIFWLSVITLHSWRLSHQGQSSQLSLMDL